MTELAPDDAPKPDPESEGSPSQEASDAGGADNTGAIEANQVNPDLPLIQPAAD